MKRVLCYFSIIVLLGLIIAPPILRALDKDELNKSNPGKATLLSCTKDDVEVSFSYLDGKAYNMVLTVTKEFDAYTGNEYTRFENKFHSDLKRVGKAKVQQNANKVIYTLAVKDLPIGVEGFNDYLRDMEEQYEAMILNSYSCITM